MSRVDWAWSNTHGFYLYESAEGYPSLEEAKTALIEMLKKELPRVESTDILRNWAEVQEDDGLA